MSKPSRVMFTSTSGSAPEGDEKGQPDNRPPPSVPHELENDYTEVIGKPIPFQDPVMHTDEFKKTLKDRADLTADAKIHSINDTSGGTGDEDEGGRLPLLRKRTHGQGQEQDPVHPYQNAFMAVIGDNIPFLDPNVHTDDDLVKLINKTEQTSDCTKCVLTSLCAATILCLPYVCCNSVLVEQDSYGFSDNNGILEILLPGRHVTLSPLNRFVRCHKKNEDIIQEGPVSIIRVKLGEFGLADDNAHPVVLLPGLHVYNDGKWRFDKFAKQSDEYIEHGPVKFLTVKSGFVRVCYIKGRVHVYPEGRYAINDPTFTVGAAIDMQAQDRIVLGPVSVVRIHLGEYGFADDNAHPVVLLPGLHLHNDNKWRFIKAARQNDVYLEHGPIKFFTVNSGYVRVCFIKGKVQIFPEGRYAVNEYNFIVDKLVNMQMQNVRFEQHPVLLDGGVKMLVEGLLTYQVEDAVKVVTKIGPDALLPAVTNVAKAELSHVFATVHFEQISSSTAVPQTEKKDKAVLGDRSDNEGEPRSLICHHVVQYVTPVVKEWGVRVLNFQLESLKLADLNYSRDYEEATLAIAKAKSNFRAQAIQNDLLLSGAEAKARAARVEAEGQKVAVVIAAQAAAEARTIEAEARNRAAQSMNNAFGQQMALAGQQVEFAKALQVQSLTVVPTSAIGRMLTSQPMLGGDGIHS